MIVITTPTSQIGHQILDNVLDSGEPIRVIMRDPSRLTPRERARVEVVQGSADDGDVVTKAFAGADCVFWLVPPNPHAESVEGYYLDFTRPACEAITRQGVKRVVAVSSLGREVAKNAGLLSGAYAMDALLESTGVSYRALRMPAFMDNMLWQVEAIKSQGMFFGSQSGDRKLPACAIRDIAAAAAKLLLDDSWSGQGSVPVLGPEDMSFNEMAQIMSEVLERPIRYQQVPGDAYKSTMMQHGMGEAYAQGLIDMEAKIDRGIYNATPRTPLSTTPTSFRQWCEEVLKPAVLSWVIVAPERVVDAPMSGRTSRVAGGWGRELGMAREELRARDPVMRGLIDANPNLDIDTWRGALPVEGLFQALLFQIVGQQISVYAMNAIHARLRALFPGGYPDPDILAQTPVDVLRSVGLSVRKAEYVKDLARRAAAGELDGLADLSHEEARNKLVSFRGIGPWTADGALLIAFGLPDVLVSGDLVLRKAVQRAYGLPELPSEKEVEAIGERWRPHRSLAATYLFDSLGLT